MIIQLKQQLSSKDALFVVRENGVHFGKASFIESNDVSENYEEDGSELKQCDALFGHVQTEKSRISILDGRASILDGRDRASVLDSRVSILDSRVSILDSRVTILEGDQDKVGLPICAFTSATKVCKDAYEENDSSMMFEEIEIADMSTGNSLKQTSTRSTRETQQFTEECDRVTTTEANDIFDEEIWNHQVCSPQKQRMSIYQEEPSQIREKPEEEFFRLVSPNSF